MSEVLSQGGGSFDLRVAIEGCPLEFCSAHAMAGLVSGFAGLDGVRRVGGLQRDGLSFQESAYLPGAEYKASLGSVSIEDTDESVSWNTRAASSVFSKVPRDVAYLAATVDASTTTWTVKSAAGLTVGSVYHIDTEAVRIESITPGVDGAPDEIEVTRGMWRTTGQAHYVAVSTLVGDSTQLATMWSSPPTYRRRRVWIYGHGPSETGLSSSGSLLARGIIASAPTLSDSSTWSFPLASLVSLFDAEIGPREGAGFVTGIYYPGVSPYRLQFVRMSGTSRVSGSSISSAFVNLAGRWDSNETFCAALNEAIAANATIASWDEKFDARPIGNGWEMFVRTGGVGTVHYVYVFGGSVIDGQFIGQLHSALSGPSFPTDTVTHDEEYGCTWVPDPADPLAGRAPPGGQRGVPRAIHFAWGHAPSTFDDITNYPWHRMYLASLAGIEVGDILRVTQDTIDGDYAMSWDATITEVNTTVGFVTWDPDTMRWATEHVVPGREVRLQTVITPVALPKVQLVRDLGTGHVGTMLRALVADAPELANGGTVPFLLSEDFDNFDTIDAAIAEAASGRPWLSWRRYVFATSIRFADLIKHELRW